MSKNNTVVVNFDARSVDIVSPDGEVLAVLTGSDSPHDSRLTVDPQNVPDDAVVPATGLPEAVFRETGREGGAGEREIVAIEVEEEKPKRKKKED